MSSTLEFFFDVSSPWTYLAFHRIEDFCAELGLDLVWKPFLVGGVFNKVNPSVYQRRENPVPPKDAYYRKDMDDWARYEGIVIGKPSVFPVNSVKAMRGCFHAIDEGRVSAFARGCFEPIGATTAISARRTCWRKSWRPPDSTSSASSPPSPIRGSSKSCSTRPTS